MPEYWNVDWDEGSDMAFLDARSDIILQMNRMTICVTEDGSISIFPPQVVDEPLKQIRMALPPMTEKVIEKVERDNEYVRVYFPSNYVTYLQIKYEDEGLVFDWWHGDMSWDSTYIFWDELHVDDEEEE